MTTKKKNQLRRRSSIFCSSSFLEENDSSRFVMYGVFLFSSSSRIYYSIRCCFFLYSMRISMCLSVFRRVSSLLDTTEQDKRKGKIRRRRRWIKNTPSDHHWTHSQFISCYYRRAYAPAHIPALTHTHVYPHHITIRSSTFRISYQSTKSAPQTKCFSCALYVLIRYFTAMMPLPLWRKCKWFSWGCSYFDDIIIIMIRTHITPLHIRSATTTT